jgi:hypothetical protein
MQIALPSPLLIEARLHVAVYSRCWIEHVCATSRCLCHLTAWFQPHQSVKAAVNQSMHTPTGTNMRPPWMLAQQLLSLKPFCSSR